jgi:hypothetical protein
VTMIDPDTLDRYTFLVTSLLTGDILDEVDLSAFNFTETINRPGSGQAFARIDSPSTTETNFLPWGNALWALKGDQVIFAGFMGQAQPRSGTKVIQIPLHGFMEYYRTQIISAVGRNLWANGQQLPGEPGHPHLGGVRFDQVEQFEIFQDLVLHVGRRDQLANLRPFVTWDEPSGVLRDDTWWNYEYKFVGIAVEQLADRINGFLWHQIYSVQGNRLRFGFKLRYPTDGLKRNILLEFDSSPEQTNVWEYTQDSPSRPANSVIALGEGEGPDAIVARVDSKAHPFGAFTRGLPRYYAVRQHSDVKRVPTLQAHADKYHARHFIPIQHIDVEMVPGSDPYYLNFNLGDRFPVRIEDEAYITEDEYRVTSRKVVLTKEGDELVTFGLERANLPPELEDS